MIREFIAFLRERKKLWMLPIILVLILIVALVILGQTTALGSLLYPLF